MACGRRTRVFVSHVALSSIATAAAILLAGTSGKSFAQTSPTAATIAQSDENAALESADQATRRIYELAGKDRNDDAVALGARATARFPDSSGLWEAYAFALRGARHYTGALNAYDHVLRADPNNRNAIKGQALVLEKLGAMEPAADLVSQHAFLEKDPDLHSVRVGQAAIAVRAATSAPTKAEGRERGIKVLAQLDELIAEQGGELAAARAEDPPVFDRLEIYVLLHREDDAIASYERMAAAGMRIPDYARRVAAVAYTHLRRPAQAIPLLTQVVAAHPDNLDYQVDLFYALVDNDQFSEAIELAQQLVHRTPPKLNPGTGYASANDAYIRALDLLAMGYAYDEHLALALQILDALIRSEPADESMLTDRGNVDLWRSWPRLTRDAATMLLSVKPQSTSAMALRLNAMTTIGEWVDADREFSQLNEDALNDHDQFLISRNLAIHAAPELDIEVGGGTGSQVAIAGNRDLFVDARLYSSPIDDVYRLYAHQRTTWTDIDFTRFARSWSGAGLQYQNDGIDASVEVAAVSHESSPALSVRTAVQLTDMWSIGAAASTSDIDTPARASLYGISLADVELSTGYDWNESTGVGLILRSGQFTDGNHRNEALFRFSQRLYQTGTFKLQSNTYVGWLTDSLGPAQTPYFSPTLGKSIETELRAEWLGYHDTVNERIMHHVVSASVGVFDESGYGSLPLTTLRYEQRWTLYPGTDFAFGVARTKHPYDGAEEFRTIGFIRLSSRFL